MEAESPKLVQNLSKKLHIHLTFTVADIPATLNYSDQVQHSFAGKLAIIWANIFPEIEISNCDFHCSSRFVRNPCYYVWIFNNMEVKRNLVFSNLYFALRHSMQTRKMVWESNLSTVARTQKHLLLSQNLRARQQDDITQKLVRGGSTLDADPRSRIYDSFDSGGERQYLPFSSKRVEGEESAQARSKYRARTFDLIDSHKINYHNLKLRQEYLTQNQDEIMKNPLYLFETACSTHTGAPPQVRSGWWYSQNDIECNIEFAAYIQIPISQDVFTVYQHTQKHF